MKKILILTVSAGEGHNSVAKAISNKLKENPENIVKTVNLFKDLSNEFKYKITDEGYILSCRYVLFAFNKIFKKLSDLKPLNREKSPIQATVLAESPELLKSVYNFKPDVIVLTHCFPAVILTNLRKLFPINAKIVGIVTDYMVHPFWEASNGIDYIISPADEMELDIVKRGYNPEFIKPLGLPTRKEFNSPIDKLQARKNIGLDEKMFTILVMNGGAFGKTDKIVKQLIKIKYPVQICVVNGRDQKSYETMNKFIEKNKKLKHKILNFGFVNNVHELMSASDVLVGKCGCISINESLNIGLPLLGFGKLPYQEIKNLEFLDNNKCAIKIQKDLNLKKAVELLIEYPNISETLKENIQKFKKPNALNDICALLESFEDNVDYSQCMSPEEIDNAQVIKQIVQINSTKTKEKRKRKHHLKKIVKNTDK